MRGKKRLPWPVEIQNRRMGLLVIAMLVMVAWPAHTILAGPLSQQVQGAVRLQGRQDHSGVEVRVQVQAESGDFQSFSASAPVTTQAQGDFDVPAGGKFMITACKPGYLDAQAVVDAAAAEPLDLGPTTLYGGEVTGDNLIDINDLAYLGARFATSELGGDINGDGEVDILDLSMAAANFAMRGPTPWGE
jgi:hypothetical protein